MNNNLDTEYTFTTALTKDEIIEIEMIKSRHQRDLVTSIAAAVIMVMFVAAVAFLACYALIA